MSENPTVIVYGKRTPIGKLSGALSSVPAPKLTATLIKDAIACGIKPEWVEEIIMGNVLTSGIGQAPARQAALYGGLPKSVCATTIGRVCGSGLKAVMLADQAIRLGDSKFVIAGGQENMSLAPHLLMNSRQGYRFGSVEAKDSMQYDGLWDPYGNKPMGDFGELCAKEYQFSREDQDDFAIESYTRARNASEKGYFDAEMVPVEVSSRRKTTIVDKDEEPSSVDLEKLRDLRPAFAKDGTVTAGNASSINDGAAILCLTDLKTAQANGLTPLAKIVSQASAAQEPEWFTTAPIACIKKLLKKTNLETKDIDLWEINEAFSTVTMVAMKELELKHDQVNVNGGAVSLGHPIGCSGARILVTLLHAMNARNAKRGLATLCIGGGEASGVIIEKL